MDPEQNKLLDEFRESWKQELKEKQNNEPKSQDKFEMAKSWFLQGSDLERQGKVYDAMRFYRKACQLVPDIDFRIREEFLKTQRPKSENKREEKPETSKSSSSSRNDTDDPEIHDLIDHFHKAMAISIGHCERASSPGTISSGSHISNLPVEIILFILKWVVSNDLDFKSLEAFGQVCRGFYLAARDPEIWKIACTKVWGNDLGLTTELYPTYRNMFMNRPRVNFHGCYISKITYLRYGENSFQDQFYRPLQLVEYYRFIRFFSDGKIAMFTSADELQTSINKMKNLQTFLQQKDILIGNYKLQDDNVIIVANKNRPVSQKQRRRKDIDDFGNITFFIELEIQKTKRKFTKLNWRSYSAMQLKNGQELLSEFELQSSKYPSFFFSPVKTIHSESTNFLQL